ncbi:MULTISPECIES: SDR family NAD(P)-dependent oxidoreductase [unclassified Agarivorans]|uniref:SDR family NAD(P)-dependent oxidoreductase n=1 Tax=unclassified Agarivorans TaxID=2636026 RepID=UPI003D7EC061
MHALVIGGSGGIGLALVKQLCQDLRFTRISATWHSHPANYQHPKLHWTQLDIRKENDISKLFADMKQLDWLINSAGLLHNSALRPEKSLAECHSEAFMLNMHINALPCILLAKHSAKLLKQSKTAIFASISAKLASIEDNRIGGWYSYRCAKAAQNMALKSISIEWRRSHPNCCVAALHPGTTDTPLSQPYQNNVPAAQLFTPGQSANYLLAILHQLKACDSGQFWSWDGQKLPW